MKGQPVQANIHPLVLLSIVDHFNRVNPSSTHKRVVGALLGTLDSLFRRDQWGRCRDQQQLRDPFRVGPQRAEHLVPWPPLPLNDVHHVQESTNASTQINAKEKFVGWYTTGSQFKPQDIRINEVFRRYADHPVFVVVDVERQVMVLSDAEWNRFTHGGLCHAGGDQ